MEYYEKVIYQYQTHSRGFLSKEDLELHFKKMLPFFEYHLNKYLPSDKNARIIDIPCGSGKVLYYLNQKGYTNSIGYDLDPQQINLAKKLNLPAHIGDALEILSRNNQSEIILLVDFFEHLSKNDTIKVLKACFENLKKDGKIIIRVPSADGIFGVSHLGNDFTHKWVLTESAWKNSLLPAVGFDKKKITVNDDRIPPLNLIPRIIYHFSNFILRLYIKSLAIGPPNILSRSMWIIASK